MKPCGKVLLAGALCVAALRPWERSRAADIFSQAPQTETNRLDFGVFWPSRVPSEARVQDLKPLLNGVITIRVERPAERGLAAHIGITLSRAADEESREFWNARLAFPEYDWMRYVRVWDADNRWLWPNLAYLLRLHGTERVDRYGGVDPGKGVDNDFAAVLIRKYDGGGQKEDENTKQAPLVAAEWYPVGVSGVVDKQTLAHAARSEEFTLQLVQAGEPAQGRAAVWLIYADFLGAKPPAAWPKTPEFAGGILAYFEVQWDIRSEPGKEIVVQQLVPPRSTGFDWEHWTARTRAARDSRVTARLSDEAGINPVNSELGQSVNARSAEATNGSRVPGSKTNPRAPVTRPFH